MKSTQHKTKCFCCENELSTTKIELKLVVGMQIRQEEKLNILLHDFSSYNIKIKHENKFVV